MTENNNTTPKDIYRSFTNSDPKYLPMRTIKEEDVRKSIPSLGNLKMASRSNHLFI